MTLVSNEKVNNLKDYIQSQLSYEDGDKLRGDFQNETLEEPHISTFSIDKLTNEICVDDGCKCWRVESIEALSIWAISQGFTRIGISLV